MTNRELLKEAIADAKAVKEVAITNAKAALEEAFTPHLKLMLEKQLTEMDKDEYVTDKTEADDKPFSEKEAAKITDYEKVGNKKDYTDPEGEKEEMDEELDLEELLRELEDEDSEESLDDEEPSEESEEIIDFENMTPEDLEAYIEKVVDEMIEAGELEAGHPGMEDEPGAEESEEGEKEMTEADDEHKMQEPGKIMAEKVEDKKEEEETEKMRSLENDLAEALKAINILRSELNEVNLLNSKLLYTNKIFKAKNLSEAQKVQVLAAFDNAETVKETKLVYETLITGLNKASKKELVRENKSFASKTISGTPKQPVVETNAMVERFQKLAGLK